MGWSADKVDDITALPCRTQDGGYALLFIHSFIYFHSVDPYKV